MVVIKENCQDCGVCCKWTDVFATESEVEKIARVSGLKPEEFCWPDSPTEGWSQLKWQTDGHCFFYKKDCSIYNLRPEICQNFPSTAEEKAQCPQK